MIALLLTRYTPTRLVVKPRPVVNTFHDVTIDLDKEAQGAVIYLQRLITDELQGGFSVEVFAPKGNCSHEQLLRLSATLQAGDPESEKPERLLLNPVQYATLGQYLSQQIDHVLRYNTSRVWDVSVETVRAQLLALWNALNDNRTRILTWTELCRIPTS